MRDDVLYTYTPRWIEESGIPEELVNGAGEAAWPVFKKLVEAETEQNFFPDWFMISRQDICGWSGVLAGRLDEILTFLENEGFIERKEGVTPGGLERFRIQEPLLSDEETDKVRARLKSRGYVGVKNLTLRYIDPMPAREKFRTVRLLYEEVFGMRMNSRIADDLREITERFDLALIMNAFEEMRRKPNKSLGSLITRLYRGEKKDAAKKDK